MDKDTEKYFDDYFDLFVTKGWKAFIDDMGSNLDTISSITNIADAKELHYKQGQVNIINAIINFELVIRNAHTAASDSSDEGEE
jgi:hypothetical protein